jgi:hypothetical protein
MTSQSSFKGAVLVRMPSSSLNANTRPTCQIQGSTEKKTTESKDTLVPMDCDDSSESSTCLFVTEKEVTSKLRNSIRTVMVTRGLKMKEIEIYCPYSYTASSTAGGSLSSVCSVDTQSVSEIADLSALYAEVKCLGGTVDYYLTSDTGGDSLGVVSYNPTVPTALTSVVNGMEASNHLLWGQLSSGRGRPQPFSKNGLLQMGFKVPNGGTVDTSTATNICGLWGATDATSNIYGYLKWYVGAVSGVTWTLSAIVRLKLKLRTRQ